MPASASESCLFIDQDMGEGVVMPFAQGSVAIYSSRCPDRESGNEDAAAVLPSGTDSGVLVVADGLGGQPGGKNASEITLRTLQSSFRRTRSEDGVGRSDILDALEHANEAVMDLGIGAATTLVAVEIDGPTLRPYHIGDSGILVVGQQGKIKLQTISHSPIGYALESGLLNEREAMHHEERHLISNVVGAADMRIEVGSRRRLASRDTVLLATDGLLDNLTTAEIVETIRTKPLDRVCAILAETARKRMCEPKASQPSKPDDMTFVLYRMHS